MIDRKTTSKRAEHRKGMARVFAFFTVIGLASAAFGIRFARAEVLDQSLVVGRQMTELARSSKNEISHVVLNGQSIMFANQLSHDTPEHVLARYEKLCRDEAAQSPEEWRDLRGDDARTGTKGDSTTLLRAGTRDEGTVMCFVKGGSSKATAKEALDSFARTGELGAFGQLRYAYVKKTAQGNTSILAAWTLDHFDLKGMLPADADAPGNDFAELPRPDGSRRLFSIRIEGEPYGINVYESNAAPAEVAATYDGSLTKQGWFALDIDGERKQAEPRLAGVTGRLYEKDGILMTVAAHLENGKTITALGVSGIADRPTASR